MFEKSDANNGFCRQNALFLLSESYCKYLYMKNVNNKILLAIILLCFVFSNIKVNAQTTATNFTTTDCDGDTYDLFTQLDAGKVVVIVWVMPCAGCISGALAAYSTVESYASSNPGKVLYYLADDYANTTCPTLRGWANTNGITNATFFSNAAVDMADYGVAGMPKVVVLGGSNHTVFYNENNLDINESGIGDAIDAALLVASVPENETTQNQLSVFPNPSNETVTINIEEPTKENSSIVLFDLFGNIILDIKAVNSSSDQNSLKFNTRNLNNGTYIIKYTSGGISKFSKLSVIH